MLGSSGYSTMLQGFSSSKAANLHRKSRTSRPHPMATTSAETRLRNETNPILLIKIQYFRSEVALGGRVQIYGPEFSALGSQLCTLNWWFLKHLVATHAVRCEVCISMSSISLSDYPRYQLMMTRPHESEKVVVVVIVLVVVVARKPSTP